MNKVLKGISQSFFDLNRKKLYLQHPLRWLEIEITRKCNLACLHCGSSCELKSSYANEMSEEQIISILKRVAEHYKASEIKVAVTGGEPLMRKDIYRILARISEMGFQISLVTNGYFINAKSVKILSAAGVCSISVSLDGLKENHNWLRGRSDAFDQAVRAMKEIRRSELFYLEPLTTVNKKNLSELQEMQSLVFDEIRADSWRLFQTMPIGRSQNNSELLLNGRETRQLLDFIKTQRKKKVPLFYGEEGWLGSEYEMEVRDYFHFCPAGVYLMSLLADGSVIGCTAMDHAYIEGNALSEDIVEIWEKRFKLYRNRDWMREGICKDCSSFTHCQGDGLHLRTPRQKGPVRCVYHKIQSCR